MDISRRAFFRAGLVATYGTRLVIGQQPSVFTLELPDVQLFPGAETFIGMNASEPGSYEVELFGPAGAAMAKWAIEKAGSQSQSLGLLKSAGDSIAPVKHAVKIRMQPSNNAEPSIAVAITQPAGAPGPGRAAGGRGGVGSPPAPDSLGQAGQMAKLARFVVDPARQPGYFLVDLATDGSLVLKIWNGGRANGRPIYEETFEKLTPGRPHIPWDLKAGGVRVDPGRYIALLVCTPDNTALRPTNLISYFRVSAG